MTIKQTLVGLTPELLTVLKSLQVDDQQPRGPLVEKMLWQNRRVIAEAKKLKIERPERQHDGRGRKVNK